MTEPQTVTTKSSIKPAEIADPRTPKGPDWSNRFLVNKNANGTQITHPPTVLQSLSRHDALLLAAWLLAVNDVSSLEVDEALETIDALKRQTTAARPER